MKFTPLKSFACVLLLAAIVPLAKPAFAAQDKPAQQESEKREAWQQEFDELCSKTTDAMTLSADELKTLIQRCDALEPRIQKLDETRQKVYLRRLRQCRGLYAYVLESKNVDKNDRKK